MQNINYITVEFSGGDDTDTSTQASLYIKSLLERGYKIDTEIDNEISYEVRLSYESYFGQIYYINVKEV